LQAVGCGYDKDESESSVGKIVTDVNERMGIRYRDKEWALAWFYSAESVWPLQILIILFVHLSDPTWASPWTPVGPFQFATTILAITQRSLLSRVKEADHLGHEYRIWYIVDGTFWPLFFALFLRQRRLRIQREFTKSQLSYFVYRNLPATILSSFASILFVISSTASCLVEKFEDGDDTNNTNNTDPPPTNTTAGCRDKEGERKFCAFVQNFEDLSPKSCNFDENMCQCQDRNQSNSTLSFLFVFNAIVFIAVVPFMRTKISMDDLIRFDVGIVQQVSLISVQKCKAHI
jgi:hypothetical protein